jgi:eukaryotic-like serine/threonine-protein kinase
LDFDTFTAGSVERFLHRYGAIRERRRKTRLGGGHMIQTEQRELRQILPPSALSPRRSRPAAASLLAAMTSSPRLHSGREIGGYRLTERLGSGGMGEVWRAEHHLLNRSAAIKFHRTPISQNKSFAGILKQRRFQREAQVTAMLRSPHTVTVYDTGKTEDGWLYYVMELLEGLDLAKMVRRFGPFPPERAIHFLLQACESLAEAHLEGMVHRDIKPQNLFVCHLGPRYDFLKVFDFGLVKSSSPSRLSPGRLTLENSITGTPACMSPEQAEGRSDVDTRSDIYSLGCVAYWLLTGKYVFEDRGTVRTLMAHIQESPVPPSQRIKMEIPESLEKIVLSCLEKNPERRPQSVTDVAQALAECPIRQPWSQWRAETWWREREQMFLSRPLGAKALSIAEITTETQA